MARDWFEVFNDRDLQSLSKQHFGRCSLSLFYSNPERTLRQGRAYWVALNPGGGVEIPSQSRKRLVVGVDREDWSAYVDECWHGAARGAYPHQRNVQIFANQLGIDLRRTFCTDALFLRGNISALRQADRQLLWKACEPWHEERLGVVRPEVIVAVGTETFNWFSGLLESPTEFCADVRCATFSA